MMPAGIKAALKEFETTKKDIFEQGTTARAYNSFDVHYGVENMIVERWTKTPNMTK